MSTVKSKKLQVGTDATATNNFTIYQPATPDGTLRIGVGNADSPTEVAQFNSTGIVGDGSQLTGLPAGYTDSDALTLFNASGSAPVYACRAWVNFNGTGTVAIRGSGNVSSITDNGTGDYTANFTTAMPDANYAVVAATSRETANFTASVSPNVYTTSSIRFFVRNVSNAVIDVLNCNIGIFR